MAVIAARSEFNAGAGLGPPVARVWLRRIARRFWRGLREWCGDAAYECYLRSKNTKSGSGRPLSPAEFYVEQLDRRYSRPNRCC